MQKGRYVLNDDIAYLLFMPHCSRPLYESLLHTNFSPALGRSPARVILGNDLAEYTGYVRAGLVEDPTVDFTKAKKKRKGKEQVPITKDGVLERLGSQKLRRRCSPIVPHLSVLSMSTLPETNLPGFARAFLSLCFQWLPEDKCELIDFDTPLPAVVWPEDGEVA